MKFIEKIIDIYTSLEVNKWPHVSRVIHFAHILSQELRLEEKEKKILLYAAALHDVGYQQFFAEGKKEHSEYSVDMCPSLLKNLLSDEEISLVQSAIRTHSNFEDCSTVLQKALFDADKLDKLTLGELVRKSLIYHNKGLDEKEIVDRMIRKASSRKFHFSQTKTIAEQNRALFKPLFSAYEELTQVPDEVISLLNSE